MVTRPSGFAIARCFCIIVGKLAVLQPILMVINTINASVGQQLRFTVNCQKLLKDSLVASTTITFNVEESGRSGFR